jgi:hypothetical protein
VSGADFTTLESAVAANTAKPTAAVVDVQIDTKNAAQLQQISLDYADRPTTYNKSEVYTKTETDASLATRTTPADVQTAMNFRFQAQDTQNFIIFQDRATSITQAQVDASVAPNTSAIAVNTAATSTNQSLIAQANSNIADVYLGNLIGLNVYNPAASGSNTLEIRCRPDATANQASLQIVHDHTASGSRAKLGFWDQTISGSSATAPSTALTLAWDGDADTHTSTFAGGLTVVGTMACTNLICTGIATMPGGGGATAGDVLKVVRHCFNPHNNVLVPTNGNWVTAITFTHTPSDSLSHLNLTFTAIWKIFTANSGDDGEWLIQIEVDGSAVGGTLLRTIGTSETGSSSPCIGQYVNASLASKTITVRARQTASANDQLMFNNAGTDSTWLHIEETKR